MKILAIDTSTEACSAALYIDGSIVSRFELAPQKHSQLILPMCDELLAETEISLTQLDAIAFGQGPGSFTGLRIAAGVTQGIAFAADLPVIGISTLSALAQKVAEKHPQTHILTAIDARMQEIYWAMFQSSEDATIIPLSEEQIGKPETLPCFAHDEDTIAVGSGWQEYEAVLRSRFKNSNISQVYPSYQPSAKEIAKLAAVKFNQQDLLPPEQAIPVYLRNDVVKAPSLSTKV